jgi:hypothetical protein
LEVPYHASPEPGNYSIYLFQQVSEEGYLDDNTQYDSGLTNDSLAYSCYGVVLAEEPEFPWRLAFESSFLGVTGINVYDFVTGYSYYPSINNGVCNNAEPAWWPDGEWVLYQADCLIDYSEGYLDATLDGDYDLFASNLDPDSRMTDEERHVQLTDTPDLDETEPDSNVDGVLVYRKTPAGTPPDESGELWLLNFDDETDTNLDLTGRAPTWSPDGSRIAFMSDRAGDGASENEGSWQVYVYDVGEEKLTLVSEDCATQCRNPAWSPDGKQIIYEASATIDDLTPAGLWTASSGATGKPRLYLEGQYGHPTWSAEGWIFFQGPHGLYRAKPGRRAVAERFLYSDPDFGDLLAPQWTY